MSWFKSKKNSVFFIAEIGGNHEGDYDYAKSLVQLGLKTRADAIKFQIYTGDTLVSPIESPSRNQHFKKFEFPIENYKFLADMCQKNGTIFMASIWNATGLKLMDPYIPIHKIGSGDLTAFTLIEDIVATGKPIILSTGLSTLEEVRRTVDFIFNLDERYINEKKLALLQCTAAYPCPDNDANLNAILLLKEQFSLPVGYSDHTISNEAVLIAATMGADIIEMHFTDDRNGKEFRDHKISITNDEMTEVMDKIDKIKKLQGDKKKEPTASEIEEGHITSFRRSIYASKNIKKGEIFSKKNLTILRPAHGICASKMADVCGYTAARTINSFEVIKSEDVIKKGQY